MQTPGPYEAAILADSVSPDGTRLTTLIATMPRFVLAEFNTHRMLSRNSASSRAIPVKKRIEMIREDPFVPLKFGKNRSGMQSTEELEDADAEEARSAWLTACKAAIAYAETLASIGVHKQFANRVLEPFAYHTVIVTATEWENYFALRVSKYAQPEIRKVSEAMLAAMDGWVPAKKNVGEWHLPLTGYLGDDQLSIEELVKVSCARCARVSYLTHDGKRDVAADLALFDRLYSAGHMSPFEHAAMVGARGEGRFPTTINGPDEYVGPYIGNFRAPWIQFRKTMAGEAVYKDRGEA